MAFRRIILTGDKIEDVKKDLERLFELPKHKIDFPNLKINIKQGAKPNTLVVDLNGDGADSVSKKVKDSGIKFNVTSVIKNEISMKTKAELKEAIKSILKESTLKEIGPGGPSYNMDGDRVMIPKDEFEYLGIDINNIDDKYDDIHVGARHVSVKISDLIQGWLNDISRYSR